MTSFSKIKDIYHLKINLFEELLSCLALERDYLINLNVENLWSLIEEKQGILKGMEEAREEIKSIKENTPSDQVISLDEKRSVAELSRKINDLKAEVRASVEGNVEFIKEMLSFYDDLISCFIKGCRPDATYHQGGKARIEPSPLIYRREV